MPTPSTGESEYVELYNANPFAVDVSGWQIDDSEEGSRPYTLQEGSGIPANSHFLATRSFGLNNSGACVRLLAPDGSLRAAMPLPRLTLLQAAQLTAKHLDNRARSRKSRVKRARSS